MKVLLAALFTLAVTLAASTSRADCAAGDCCNNQCAKAGAHIPAHPERWFTSCSCSGNYEIWREETRDCQAVGPGICEEQSAARIWWVHKPNASTTPGIEYTYLSCGC